MACGLASADTITQTFTLSPTNTDIIGSIGTGTFNNFLTQCPSCDPSWLTGVRLLVSVGENLNTLSVTNTASETNSFEYQTFSNLTLVGTAPSTDQTLLGFGLFLNRAAFQSSPGGCSAGVAAGSINLCDTGSTSFASGETKNFAPPVVTASDSSGTVNASNITPYDTTGTFTLGFTTTTFQSFIGGGGNGQDSQATQAFATIQVLYDYAIPSSTPEPTTMVLFGSALVGLGVLRKRIKS